MANKQKGNREDKEFVSPGQELKEVKRFSVKELIGGGILTRDVVVKQIPFIMFLFALLILYIANQYQGAKLMKNVIRIENRLKVLRTESISTTFRKMEMSKQSEVIKLIEEKGLALEEAELPPYKIKVE